MNDRTSLARIDAFPYQHRIREVMAAPVITAAASMRLIDAIGTMFGARVSWIVVVDLHGRVAGILTERDVTRLVATLGVRGIETTLGAAMSRPVVTVNADAFVYTALGKMARQNLRHLVVTDDDGHPVGVVTPRTLLKIRVADALAIGELIEDAAGPAQLRQAVAVLPHLVKSLLDDGVAGRNIAAVIAMTIRDVTARAAQLAEKAMESEPPAAYAMLVLGPVGRGEVTLSFAQDNAIVHEAEDDAWFLDLGRRMNAILEEAGVPRSASGLLAGEPGWCKSRQGWNVAVARWTMAYQTERLARWDLFFDLQPVWGDRALAERLRREAIDTATGSPLFLQHMAHTIGQMDSALGLFNRFLTVDGRLNLAGHGLMPLVSAARYRAIRAGITATTTDERFTMLADRGLLHEDDCRDFAEMREVFLRAMLSQQLIDLAAGETPTPTVEPRRMDKRGRARLRWALRRLDPLRHACAAGR
jgi:signal-transduction protein with cAMP-binding, CBS, and nucleotidyltransferase domain